MEMELEILVFALAGFSFRHGYLLCHRAGCYCVIEIYGVHGLYIKYLQVW